MINLDDLVAVGRFAKTHGVQGEINVDFTVDVDMDECRYFVVEMDGIPVPFFIESYRYRNDTTALVSIDGIDTEPSARLFFGKTVYVEPGCIDDEAQESAAFYVGYTLVDRHLGDIGRITDVDDTTANVLFTVGDRLIPVAALEVIHCDDHTRRLTVSLPDGLLDL